MGAWRTKLHCLLKVAVAQYVVAMARRTAGRRVRSQS